MANQIIEEMSEDLYKAWCNHIIIGNKYEWVMEQLYNKGYRKIPEGSVVIPKEISVYTDIKRNVNVFKTDLGERVELTTEQILFFTKLYHFSENKVRKETAEKFAEAMRDCYTPRDDPSCTIDDRYMLDRIDEVYKEITEG